jgi:hypothetical protein
MAEKQAHRLKNRFAGKEQEILRSIRVRGSIATMIRYEVSDYVCWSKYIDVLRQQFAQEDTPGEFTPADNEVSESMSIIPTGKRELSINVSDDNKRLFLGNCPNHRQLADELVEAFTEKIVKLSAENARLYAENEDLKNRLNYIEDKNDDDLSARIIHSIGVINRC